MPDKYINLDANETVFFDRELEHIKSQAYDVKFPELKAKTLIPVSTEAGAGAESITYRSYEGYGIAKVIASYADDLPRADVGGKEFTTPVRSLGESYGYNIQEVRASQMANKSLPTRKANACRQAIERKEESIAWLGEADSGLTGLINAPGIQTYTVPADGTGSVSEWNAKSADLILRDMNDMITQVISTTKGVENPNIILLPIAQFRLINSTARSTTSDTTILEHFLRNNPGVSVEWVNQMAGAGAGGDDIMMGYNRDPMKLTLEIPQPFEQFPVQERGLEFVVPCHSRVGGVIVYYPLSVIKGEGI